MPAGNVIGKRNCTNIFQLDTQNNQIYRQQKY